MSAAIGQLSPGQSIKDGQTSITIMNEPRLVAPKPIHAGLHSLGKNNGSALSSASHPVIREESGEEPPQQNQYSSSLLVSSSLRTRTDIDAILPVQGEEQDAIAAVEKLERMQKALQSKRMWLRGTGVEGMAIVATAGGKESWTNRTKRRLKKKAVKEEEVDAGISLPEYGEVELDISAMPGYRLMAKEKAKHFLNRANIHAEDNKEMEREPRSSMESAGDESISRFRPSSLKHPHALRHRQKELSPAIEIEPPRKVLQDNINQGQAPPTTPAEETSNATVATSPQSTLTAVEEGVPLDVVPKAPRSEMEIKKPLPKRGPMVMIQSPTEKGSLIQRLDDKDGQCQTSLTTQGTSNSSSSSEEDCDGKAQQAADTCQDHIANPSLLSPAEGTMHESPSSSSSMTSDGESFSSDDENSSNLTKFQDEFMLNLEHGEELTRKQRKKILRRRRKSATSNHNEDQMEKMIRPKAQYRNPTRSASLSNRMQVGLHYATSQSRNRRAMERYSPHPSRPSSTAPLGAITSKLDSSGNLVDMPALSRPGTNDTVNFRGDVSRSSTPGIGDPLDHVKDSRRSSVDEIIYSGGRDSPIPVGENSFCLSPIVDNNMNRDDQWSELIKNPPQRQGTLNSLSSTTTGNLSFRKRYFSLKRKKQDTLVVAEESDSGQISPAAADPEKELDHLLGKLIAQQAPQLLQEQYEYDILYENQRGLMFFGIPKFSAKTLFQWDPASWTNAYNENSAYNVVNAQLPDPAWEWVHPEWMIDMTGDVDESGWQYSYNFGRLAFNVFHRPTPAVPRAGVQGNVIMNERMAKKYEQRQEKEKSREDEGFEALMRTARTRSAKWSGIPDQNKYVRRRRWIRLRRRKALPMSATAANTPSGNTPLGIGKVSGDWSFLVKEEQKKVNEQTNLDALSSSDSESISDLESDEADSVSDYESNEAAGSSAFLPRRIPGHLQNGVGPNASKPKPGKAQARLRQHAKEFTGTIRELKCLLPAILDPYQGKRNSSNRKRMESDLWMSEIDARNPFISWNLVKKRLDDDDLAWASTSIRARERRYAQKLWERKETNAGGGQGIEEEHDAHCPRYELTKDALVEINYRRVMRIMKACKVDRHKLQLWKIWLGVEPVSSITQVAREEDLANAGLGVNPAFIPIEKVKESKDALKQARSRWRKAFSQADAMDVWDLLERRLDRLLLTFEYQASRASLIRLLLTIHATSHHAHRFRPTEQSIETNSGQAVEIKVPSTISPQLGADDYWNLTAAQGSTLAVDQWRAVNLPRLEFWSDLQKCARALVENSSRSDGLVGQGEFSSKIQRRSSPFSSVNRHSPGPSIIRSGTPQMNGSIANGPVGKRLSFSSPGLPSPLGKKPSLPQIKIQTSNAEKIARDRDRSFLASLLQLPAESQQEILIKSAKQDEADIQAAAPSSVIRHLNQVVQDSDEED